MKKLVVYTMGICFLILGINGCSGKNKLESKAVPKINLGKPVKGIVYYLPTPKFDITSTIQITDCSKNRNKKISASESYVVSYSMIKDVTNAYYIDYTDFGTYSTAYSHEFKFYENGLIQSINSSATDKTGDIITTFVGAAAKVALFTTAPHSAIALFTSQADTDSDENTSCTQSVITALQNKDEFESQIETQIGHIKDKVKYIKEQRDNNISPNILSEDYTTLWTLEQNLTKTKNKYNENAKKYTIITKKSFSNTYKTNLIPDDLDLEKMIIEDKRPNVKEQFTRQFIIENENSSSMKSAENNVIDGVLYRQPASANIKITRKTNIGDDVIVYSDSKIVPGIGVIATLPFSNGKFDDNKLEVDFSKQGVLTRVKYATNAKGEEVSKTVNSISDQFVEYKKNTAKMKAYREQSIKNDLLLKKEILSLESEIGLVDLNHQISLLSKLKEQENLSMDSELYKLKQELEIKKLMADIEILNDDEAVKKLELMKLELEVAKLKKDFENSN